MTHFCNRCKLAIKTDEERHIKIEDNEGKKNLSKLWFHKKCWHEIMTNKAKTSELQEKAMKMFDFAKNKLGMEEEVVV